MAITDGVSVAGRGRPSSYRSKKYNSDKEQPSGYSAKSMRQTGSITPVTGQNKREDADNDVADGDVVVCI